MHKDLGNEIMRVAQEFRFVDPESRMVLLLMKKADLIDAARLRRSSSARSPTRRWR